MKFYPKISVITVCFNEVERIESTLLSVIEQTYDNIEFIVVDGGSKDGTKDILDKYSADINVLISEPDNGIYDAMNKGAEKSTGDYLYFLNGGDRLWNANTISLVVEESESSDVIYGNRYRKHLHGEMEYKTHPTAIDAMFLLINGIICHQAAFICAKAFRKLDGYDVRYPIAADYDLFVRLKVKLNADFFYINEPICVFHTDGISHNPKYMNSIRSERLAIQRSNYPWYLVMVARFRNILIGSNFVPYASKISALASRVYRFFVPLH